MSDQTTTANFSALAEQMSGTVSTPDSVDWDHARQAWNLAADQRPDAVVLAADADDVAAAVSFACENDLRVALQSSGHGAAARDSLEGALLVRVDALDSVEIDPATGSARVGAGALWGAVAEKAGEHGLAPLSGSSIDVAVTGYTLGGGLSWLSRRYGLACNNVTAFEVVVADGTKKRIDADNDPELFWALRGGGGSFAAVTALEIALFPVEQAYAGMIVWPAEIASEAIMAYRDWARTLPEEVTSSFRFLNLPPLPTVPEPLRARPVVAVTAAFIGDAATNGEQLMAPLRELPDPIMDMFALMPAAGLGRINGDPEEPVPGIGTHAMIEELTDDAAATLVELAGPGSDCPVLFVELRQTGGAVAREPDNAGALGKLDGEYAMVSIGLPMNPDLAAAIPPYLKKLKAQMEPFSTGKLYTNFTDFKADVAELHPPDRLGRLREVKNAVDPDDLFAGHHHVAAS